MAERARNGARARHPSRKNTPMDTDSPEVGDSRLDHWRRVCAGLEPMSGDAVNAAAVVLDRIEQRREADS